ncbi:MAG: ligand-binding SRPBCC domain-containing protein [Marinoscillum sp.]|jgi:ligand-binding SRPBCC domain-containing protein
MRLKVSTPIHAPLKIVKDGFTRELFLSLNPPFPKVALKKFDGCKKGDIVAIELNFLLFRQMWVSEIIEESYEGDAWLFIDEGTELPFFLKTWHHTHRVVQNAAATSIIHDEITFTTGTLLTDILLFPGLLLQFLYRKPKYRAFFRRPSTL